MPKLAHTSVPPWAAGAAAPAEPGPSGSAYVLLGVGAAAGPVLDGWAAELAGRDTTRLDAADLATARRLLSDALSGARVGVRLRVAGPTGDCLALRATAFTTGMEDDEMHFAPTGTGPVNLHCVHCGAVTATEAAIDDVVPCEGCRRRLLVYYHVSRRTGRFLGFQVDAEEATA